MVVPVEGIEPPLLAEHDFESDYVYCKYLLLLYIFGFFLHMCKKVCQFGLFHAPLGAFRKAAGELCEVAFGCIAPGSIR
jgi:hypothetical protein